MPEEEKWEHCFDCNLKHPLNPLNGPRHWICREELNALYQIERETDDF